MHVAQELRDSSTAWGEASLTREVSDVGCGAQTLLQRMKQQKKCLTQSAQTLFSRWSDMAGGATHRQRRAAQIT